MRIAILGATSQIAGDLVLAFSGQRNHELALFVRRPETMKHWLAGAGLSNRHSVADFGAFDIDERFDAIVNFVGVGNPATAAAMGASILDVTLKYDDLAMDYLRHYPDCRYIFLSSGAAYGSNFAEPVDANTRAVIAINNLQPQDWYGVAKLYAECRHRAHPTLSIVDVRVFSYFSHTQNPSARFFITDLLRAIESGEALITSPDNIVRDYIGPDDFTRLVSLILDAPPTNKVVDCYTLAPVAKMTLLETMKEQFGLAYEVRNAPAGVNATGVKMNYYSINREAEIFGFYPTRNSLDSILNEVRLISKRI
ncbi:NAD(P)-dependent oxidoreductase [Cupriavidus sp. AcVe19-1a]|uniref:NAD-dependent epimerase/dehydratase family protein n=1 Tax=Cupriavidus sp. AcVe19-1a TaxID=2821359 RepID=UPI001AE12487|nr:NAD(P)-dependent oxidoreductase [Cupriavidus sp. AcVe19-1a]MBP0628123.1 NAD(P)-dependent oxidoreductase [Cupriavidus sp. AcVe19-1a]